MAARRLEEAVASLCRAVGNGPSGVRQYHLARAYHLIDDRESAQEAWHEARDRFGLEVSQITPYERHQYETLAEALAGE